MFKVLGNVGRTDGLGHSCTVSNSIRNKVHQGDFKHNIKLCLRYKHKMYLIFIIVILMLLLHYWW